MKPGRSVGIRGAGLAGLSLARRLVELSPNSAVSVFDTRPRLPHPPRTFCFFRDAHDDFRIPITRSWRSVRFVGTDFDRRVDCSRTPYALVRGPDYFARTVEFLADRKVEFRWDCPAVELQRDGIIVGGESCSFDVVVDAAFDGSRVSAALWQSFAGIVVEASADVFDPEEAILMDMLPGSFESPIAFVYVLPFSSTEALIEHTTFSRTPRSEEEHLAECRRWLDRRGIVVRREIARETGAIPMGIRRKERGSWPVIGTSGGGVRAGTGYGFVGIRRQVDRLAEAIVSGLPAGRRWRYDPTPWAMRIGDALFLRALNRAPLHGRTILEGLLRRASDSDIVAFLSGAARFGQSLRVMGGVPQLTMMRALCG